MQYDFKEIIFNTVDKLFYLAINLDRATKVKYLRLSDINKIKSKIIEAIGKFEENIDKKIEKEFFYRPDDY